MVHPHTSSRKVKKLLLWVLNLQTKQSNRQTSLLIKIINFFVFYDPSRTLEHICAIYVGREEYSRFRTISQISKCQNGFRLLGWRRISSNRTEKERVEDYLFGRK